MKNKLWTAIWAVLALSGCATQPTGLLTSSQDSRPSWVNSPKVTWLEGMQIYFKTQYSIRGDERLNGCYQLAKLESKEALLREIADEIHGQIDSAQQSLSENAELLLNQSRSSEFGGRVTGLRSLEQYHERTKVDGVERIDCYLLTSLSKADYDSIRREVIYKVVSVDPALKETLNRRQIQFYETKAPTQ